MNEILRGLEEQWRQSITPYSDVKAIHLQGDAEPNVDEKCSHGCALVVYESENGQNWRAMDQYADLFRQTRICRKHRYARIYVKTGLDFHA